MFNNYLILIYVSEIGRSNISGNTFHAFFVKEKNKRIFHLKLENNMNLFHFGRS